MESNCPQPNQGAQIEMPEFFPWMQHLYQRGLWLVVLGSWLFPTSAIAQSAIQPPAPNDEACDGSFVEATAQQLLPDGTGPDADATERLGEQPSALTGVPQQQADVAVEQTLQSSLSEAVRIAFSRNPDLAIAVLQLQRSCKQVNQAKAANFPTLSVSGSISRTDGGSFFPRGRLFAIDDSAQTALQQSSAFTLAQQQAIAQQQITADIALLQQRFQQTANLVQRETLQQQLDQLLQRADANATQPAILTFSPFTADSANLVLLPGTGGGGSGSFFNGTVALNYSIFTFGRRSASIKSAKKQVQSAALQVQTLLQNLRRDVFEEYYNLIQTQALIQVADSAVRNNQENLRILQVGEQAGVRTRFEVLQASVALADAQQNLTQAQNLQQIAQRQLAQRMSLPPQWTVVLPPEVEAAKTEIWDLSLEESIILALTHRVELVQNQLQNQNLRLQQQLARSQQRPQLIGIANLNVADDLEDRFLGDYGYAVGVQLSFNFFDGGEVRSQVNQLEESINSLNEQFAQLKESIRFEVEQSFFNLKANETNIETANQALTQAEESLRLAQLRLDAGVGTNLEVSRAQADLTQAQGNVVNAIVSYNRSLADLKRATGYATLETNQPAQPEQPEQPEGLAPIPLP